MTPTSKTEVKHNFLIPPVVVGGWIKKLFVDSQLDILKRGGASRLFEGKIISSF